MATLYKAICKVITLKETLQREKPLTCLFNILKTYIIKGKALTKFWQPKKNLYLGIKLSSNNIQSIVPVALKISIVTEFIMYKFVLLLRPKLILLVVLKSLAFQSLNKVWYFFLKGQIKSGLECSFK